jgi:hypothetical protein
MTSRKATQITVYWDRSDCFDQGWAYRASDDCGDFASGSLTANELHEAIDEACSELDVIGIEQDFALSIEEGGYAIWTLPQ